VAQKLNGNYIRFMKTFLVTGASSGVGLALTHLLAEQQQRVILAVRDVARGERARDEVLRRCPAATLSVERLELTDLRSVHALAARDLAIDVLVNNAGIAFEPLRLTAQGVVSQLAANHLGHFALTALLWPQLAQRADARVVTVTSTLAKQGHFDLDSLDGSRGFSSLQAYKQSKLANVLFAAELDRRVRAQGLRVKSVLAHPGVPATAMQQRAQGPIGFVVRLVSALIGKPASHGATALLAAATDARAASGELWAPGKRAGAPPRREAAWPTMSDREGALRLWERSEALCELRFL